MPESPAAKADFDATEKALEDIDTLRRRLKVQLRCELNDMPGCREVWEGRLDSWNRDSASMRDEFNRIREERMRRGLSLPVNSAPAIAAGGMSSDHYAAMQSTDRMEQGMRVLEESARLTAESEEIGQDLLMNLSEQRENMERLKANMGTVQSELSAAGRSVSRLLAHSEANQMLTASVAALFAVGLMVYFLGFLGLSLKGTVIAAVCSLLLMGLVVVARRRIQHREILEGYLATDA